jgi:hypothetical protein
MYYVTGRTIILQVHHHHHPAARKFGPLTDPFQSHSASNVLKSPSDTRRRPIYTTLSIRNTQYTFSAYFFFLSAGSSLNFLTYFLRINHCFAHLKEMFLLNPGFRSEPVSLQTAHSVNAYAAITLTTLISTSTVEPQL